ncbi:unnamed protein product [Ectocarpus sp. 13 AM-2016]
MVMFGSAELPVALTELTAPETHDLETLPAITKDATCVDWAAWIPPRSQPAVVMQVVSEGYIDIERNFIRLMERNSGFTRRNIYLMCIDDASKKFFDTKMGIRCVPMSALDLPTHEDIWQLRVRVVSCLLEVGHVDVIMSDADALWLADPAKDLFSRGGGGRGDIVASRGSWPNEQWKEWGSTLCMGFILFRARNVAGMKRFLDVMADLVVQNKDDQISVNRAARQLGVVWDKNSDMRYEESTGYGRGIIAGLGSSNNSTSGGGGDLFIGQTGHGIVVGRGTREVEAPLRVTLLPHSAYTRLCGRRTLSNQTTVVAHCYFPQKEAGVKTSWMKKANLWSVQDDP